MVIDCHCRAGNASLTPYLRRAEHAGIDRTVLFASFKSNLEAANADVARFVSVRPDRFIGFVFIHPARDRGQVRNLVREAVQAHGFRGIAVHRHDAPLTREVCEAALLFGVPVVYDVMGDVAPMEIISDEYPAVDFILPHLGNVAGDGQTERALLDLIEHKPNVFVDTAGAQRFDFLEEAIARGGAKKVLFGSGGPLLHPGLELAKILLLRLKPEDHRRVVGGNLLRLISGRSVRREHGLDAVATPRPVRIGDVNCESHEALVQARARLEDEPVEVRQPTTQVSIRAEDEPLALELIVTPQPARAENVEVRIAAARTQAEAQVERETFEARPLASQDSIRGEAGPIASAQAAAEPPTQVPAEHEPLAPVQAEDEPLAAVQAEDEPLAAAQAEDESLGAAQAEDEPLASAHATDAPLSAAEAGASPPSPAAIEAWLSADGLEICARKPSMNLQAISDRAASHRIDGEAPATDASPSSGPLCVEPGAQPTRPASVDDGWASAETVTTSLPGQAALGLAEATSTTDHAAAASTTPISLAEAPAIGHDSISASITELVEAATYRPEALTSPLPGPVESAAPGP